MSFASTTLLSADYPAQESKNSLQELNRRSRWQWLGNNEVYHALRGEIVNAGQVVANRTTGLANYALSCLRFPLQLQLDEKAMAALASVSKSACLASRLYKKIPATDLERIKIAGLKYTGSGVGLIQHCLALKNEIKNVQQAYRIEDGESKRRSIGGIASGLISSGVAILSFADMGTRLSLPSLAAAINGLSGVSSFIGVGISGVNAYRCLDLRSRLAKILGDQNLAEKDRLVNALKFLNGKVMPTKREREAILKDPYGVYRNLSRERRISLQQEKLADLAEAKIRSFKRRSDQKSVELIVEKGGAILERLRKRPDPGSIREAKLLVQEVQKENTKRMVWHALTAVIAGMIGAFYVASIILSLGPGSLLLYALLTAASIAMIIYPVFAYIKDIRSDRQLAVQAAAMPQIAKTA